MKKEVKSFLLKMAVIALGLAAFAALGAYTAGRLSADMLLSPAFLLLAAAAYGADVRLMRTKRHARPVLRVAKREPSPIRVA